MASVKRTTHADSRRDGFATRLGESAVALGLHLSDTQAMQLQAYARLLLKWNRTYNLVGTHDEGTLIAEHLMDCIAVVPVLCERIAPSGTQLIDMGSGGGLPGVVIAILAPQMQIVMVEPVAKKAAFLRQAGAVCGTPNAAVAECRMAQLGPRLEAIDAASTPPRERHFCSRAFADMQTLVVEAFPYARPGSRLFAMKSARLAEELKPLDPARVRVHDIHVPGIAAPRYLAEVGLNDPPAPRCAATNTPRSAHWPSP